MFLKHILSTGLLFCLANGAPVSSTTPSPPTASELNDPNFGPIPGLSSYYSDYRGKEAPFPAKNATPIQNTTSGPAGVDDLLFQNLLAAEWVVYSFYQQGVEAFNKSSFVDLGYPNTTWDSIAEIRDNEAGHLRLFQDSISSNNIKPGPCSYDFRFKTDAEAFLGLQNIIEISSMSFLTGLVLQAQLDSSKGALTAIGLTETRHEVWSLIEIWNVSPFAGPADTSFPYANQILDVTNEFVIPGSCPAENPPFPSPSQNLPRLTITDNTTSFNPGDEVELEFEFNPEYQVNTEYYTVYFHGLFNISVPFDTQTNLTTIPSEFEAKGVIIAVIADEIGAPSKESVVAGPLFIFQQPTSLNSL